MILHPGILGLLIGSAITLLMVLYAGVTGTIILARWDFSSSSSRQLLLERKTYLVSTLVNYGLGFQVISCFLFIYTMDDIHRLFVGAMCATGSLNANPIGWYALLSKIGLLFLSGFWLAINFIDQRSREYPLVKLKYSLLLVLLPLIGVDFFLQLAYFLGLDPAIITSCCGSLFSVDSEQTTGTLAALPVRPTMIAFSLGSLIYLGVIGLNLYFKQARYRYLLLGSTLVFLGLAIVSIISFVSIYIYEMPMHHCPFDVLQRGYNFIGYPLYFALFLAVFFGILPGLMQPLKKRASLGILIEKYQQSWLRWNLITTIFFSIIVLFAVATSNLSHFSW